jgi:CheY-like chemotaxis protein
MIDEKLHIILAEDDIDDRLFFKSAFKDLKLEYDLTICEDGLQLMDYLATREKAPHIIFLDLNMPGKNGLECLKELRRNHIYRDTSIAIYTSLASSQNHEEAFIRGANIFIKKPKELSELKKILLEVIYINWQYVSDGLNKENFMINY